MSNVKCDVIKDLIPSYVDEICSDATKELVEEHITNCDECKQSIKLLKDTHLPIKREEHKEDIDYMKKVKKHFVNKNIMIFLVLVLSIIIGLIGVISKYGNVSIRLYYVIMPILMVSSYYVLSDYESQPLQKKWKIILGVIGSILIGYSISLVFFTEHWSTTGHIPFGLKIDELGPFLYHQLLINTYIQLLIFLFTIVMCLKNAKSYLLQLNINLFGCFISLGFISLLKRSSTITGFVKDRNQIIIFMLLEAIVITLFLFGIRKKRS